MVVSHFVKGTEFMNHVSCHPADITLSKNYIKDSEARSSDINLMQRFNIKLKLEELLKII